MSIVTDMVMERVEMYTTTGNQVMRVLSPSGPIMLPELPDGIYWLIDAQAIDCKLVMKNKEKKNGRT